MKNIIILHLMILSLTTIISAKRIIVPQNQLTIQAGINSSVDGDTIIVYPGIYFENINFNGKKITLTSRYYENNDVNYILSTVINGSKPRHPDTASCVLIINHEDSTTVLQGFTITGGKGTAWVDEHGAGKYREGGGILIAKSSPVIKHNMIIYNEAIDKKGLSSAGGGGIRAGDENPTIINNIVMRNKGLYGGGIVLNYTGAILKNNIVYQNEGGQDYGSGGIWINKVNNKKPILENNTIVNNYSVTDGGGILVFTNTSITAKNNIVWGNIASSHTTSSIGIRSGGSANITFSNVQYGFNGEGNIKLYPMLQFTNNLILNPGSPCIDSGIRDELYNDPEDPVKTGYALIPSLGTIRNDMGAYGGKGRSEFPSWNPTTKLNFSKKTLDFKSIEVCDTGSLQIVLSNLGDLLGSIDSIKIINNPENILISKTLPFSITPSARDTLGIKWLPKLAGNMNDTILVFHNDTTTANPVTIKLIGKGTITGVKENDKPFRYYLMQNYPNPFNPSTTINFQIPEDEFITLRIFDLLGREIEVILKGLFKSGSYSIPFNASDYPSGIYFYQLNIEGRSPLTKKMMIIK